MIVGVILSTILVNAAHATQYTTLSDGNWEDAVIWSINGVSSCNCVPQASQLEGITVNNGVKVVVKHAIDVAQDLRLEGGAEVEVETNGQLNMPGSALKVNNGSFRGYGDVIAREVSIQSGAFLFMNGSLIVEGGNITNEGNFYMNNEGEVKEDEGGGGGSAQVMGGEFFNSGLLIFGSNSCISVGGNTFENKSGGFVSGNGYIYTDGTLINNGIWWLTELVCRELHGFWKWNACFQLQPGRLCGIKSIHGSGI